VNNSIIFNSRDNALASNVTGTVCGFEDGTVLLQLGAIHCTTIAHCTTEGARTLAAQINAACAAIEAQLQAAA
jgi:hypothetical protein